MYRQSFLTTQACRGCVCQRRLGGIGGGQSHPPSGLVPGTCGTYGPVSRHWHSYHYCKQPTATLVVDSSACLQARTIPQRLNKLFTTVCNFSCSLTAFWAHAHALVRPAVPLQEDPGALVAQQPQLRAAVGGRAVVGNLQLAPARPVLRQEEIVREECAAATDARSRKGNDWADDLNRGRLAITLKVAYAWPSNVRPTHSTVSDGCACIATKWPSSPCQPEHLAASASRLH